MKKKDKEETQTKHAYPKTLGEKMLFFAQDKWNPLMKNVHRLSRVEILPPRFNTLVKVSSHPKGKLINPREETPDFVYFRPPILSYLENKSTQRQPTHPDRVTTQPLKRQRTHPNQVTTQPLKKQRTHPNQVTTQPLKKQRTHPDQVTTQRLKVLDHASRPLAISNIGKGWAKNEKPNGDQRVALSPRILNLFSRWLKMRLPPVKLHQNEVTDRLLINRHADAMTVETDIYFRTGKFDLRNARGLGLLAHELTHVTQQCKSDWRNQALSHDAEHHENTAIDNEKFILANAHALSQQSGLSTHIDVTANSESISIPSSSTEHTMPMFADTSRDVGEVPSTAPTGLSDSDKEEFYQFVKKKLRIELQTEFEIGA